MGRRRIVESLSAEGGRISLSGDSINPAGRLPFGIPVSDIVISSDRPAMPRSMTPDCRRGLLAEVRNIYEELADRPLERECTGRAECCHFKLTGRTPFLTRGEALVAGQAVRASGRK